MRIVDKRVASILRVAVVAALGILLISCLIRIFICDSFVISGPSMEPTLHDGQRVWAFKPGIGARIYTKFDFSTPELHCFRMPGLRKLEKGDIAVFNHPYGVYPGEISFKINYVLIKRCAGTPGDTLRVDGLESFLVPSKGDRVALDSCSILQYGRQIEFETGKKIDRDSSGIISIDGSSVEEYEFTSDWYFFIGDNMAVSQDSRHFGLVPESYIIGRVNKPR